jgi:hypothetical protein
MRCRLTFGGPQSRFQFTAQAIGLLFEAFALFLQSLTLLFETLVLVLQPPDLSLLLLDLPLGPV